MPANNPKENTGSVKHGDQGRSAGRQNRNAETNEGDNKSGSPSGGGQMPKEGVSKVNESGKGSGNR